MPKRPFDRQKQNYAAGQSTPLTPADNAALTPSSRSQTPTRAALLPISQPWRQAKPYRQRQRQQNPFKCSYCGYWRIEAFATVYARGSSLSKYKRGLIFKTGWSETRRQSYLAMRCTPPKRKNIWWCFVLVGLGIAASMYLPDAIFGREIPVSMISLVLLMTGSLIGAFHFLWNRVQYPKEMARWEDSYYCSRCSKITIIRQTG